MDNSTREARALEERVRTIVLSLPDTSFLRQYVIYASSLTDCNAVYHIGAGLTLLAQTVHDDLNFRLGSRLHGNIYALAVGPSTNSRKTASVQIARELIDEAIPGQATKYPGSYEGLIDALIEKGRQLLLFEEFGALLAQAERSYLTPIKSHLTGIYDGTPVSRALAKGRRKDVAIAQKPRLSIFGACTAGYLSRHSEPVDWIDGFFSRFLIFHGERARQNDFPVQDVAESRAWLIQELRTKQGYSTALPCLGVDDTAVGMWKAWTNNLEETMKRAPKEVVGAVGRSNGHVLKIALLLSWDYGDNRQGGPWTLKPVHLGPAMDIVRLHIESVFKVGEDLAGTKDMNDRQAVLQSIGETPTPLGLVTRRSRLLRRRVLEIIETLREEKCIEVVHVTEGVNVFDLYQRVLPVETGGNVIRLFDASRQSSASGSFTTVSATPPPPMAAPPEDD